MNFVVSYSPDDRLRGIDPNEFHELLSPGYERFVANYPFDISAVHDDRPFFFDRVPLAPWLAHRIGVAKSRLGEGSLTLGVETLLASLIISAFCTALLLVMPMVVGSYRGSRMKPQYAGSGCARSKKPGVVGLGRERRLFGFWRIVGDGDFNDLRVFSRFARWSCRLFGHTYSDHRLDQAASESSHRRR